MYYQFGKTKSIKRCLMPLVVLTFLFVPLLIFLSFVLIDAGKTIYGVLTWPLMWLIAAYLPYAHIRNLYSFPLIEIDDNFLVINAPLTKRLVLTISKITKYRRFDIFKALTILHNGYPIFVNLQSLCDEERHELNKILQVHCAENGGAK